MHSGRAAEGGRAKGWEGGGGDKQGWCAKHFSAVPVCIEKMEYSIFCAVWHYWTQMKARYTASMPW